MINDNTKYKIFFAFFILILAHIYPVFKIILNDYFEISNANVTINDLNIDLQNGLDKDEYFHEKRIIKSWKNLLTDPRRKLNRNLKIAIGLNANVDLIISGTALFNQLNIGTSIHARSYQNLNNLNEFKECFKYFFQKGAAAERSFSNLNDFRQILDATNNLEKQWFIGGNAGLMAQSISRLFKNIEVMLIGPVGPKLKELLNTNILVPDNTLIEKDEVHLILEYHMNEKFENLQSPSANRFIVSHDFYNSRMEMLKDFTNFTQLYEPDIIILSGLHLLENQNEEIRQEKLNTLNDLLSINADKKNVIHLELASIGDKNLMKSIINSNIFQKINSLGLNEQELLFLAYASQIAPHSNYYLEIEGQPNLLKIIDILEWTLNTYGKFSNQFRNSKFSRIHFHSLSFHLLAIVDTNEWSNSVSSLMSGAKIATKQASGFEFENEENELHLHRLVELKVLQNIADKRINISFQIEQDKYVEFNSSNPVIKFNRGKIKFFLTPILVCKNPIKTVGLGDAISSTGLLYSIYNHPQ